jgi:hypothetical protein
MLDTCAAVARFVDEVPPTDMVFVRPAGDSKLSDGRVMSAADFLARQGALAAGLPSRVRRSPRTGPGAAIVFAPVLDVPDFRFFVVDGEIAAETVYVVAARFVADPHVAPGAWDFARAAVAEWVSIGFES